MYHHSNIIGERRGTAGGTFIKAILLSKIRQISYVKRLRKRSKSASVLQDGASWLLYFSFPGDCIFFEMQWRHHQGRQFRRLAPSGALDNTFHFRGSQRGSRGKSRQNSRWIYLCPIRWSSFLPRKTEQVLKIIFAWLSILKTYLTNLLIQALGWVLSKIRFGNSCFGRDFAY